MGLQELPRPWSGIKRYLFYNSEDIHVLEIALACKYVRDLLVALGRFMG